jgi:DNA-binding transcriptional ArsR family regulator
MVEVSRPEAQESELDRLFHALSSSARRAMLRRLSERDYTVGELAEPFDMTVAAVSKHVEVLASAGLVDKRHEGRTTLCHLNAASLAEAAQVLDYYRDFWQQRLDNLEGFLKEPQ